MDTFSLIFELMGTVAFAVSGAMTGLKKQMDLFGVAILGLTTAVGGGILRDVILGIHPPKMFLSPAPNQPVLLRQGFFLHISSCYILFAGF